MTEAERELLVLLAHELQNLLGFSYQDVTRGRAIYVALQKVLEEKK